MLRINRERQFDVIQCVVLILMFLSGMNFLARYYFMALLAFLLFVFFSKKLSVNMDFIYLLIISLSWLAFSPNATESFSGIIAPVLYPVAYCIGYNFLRRNYTGKNNEEKIIKAICCLSMGLFVHYLLNFFINFDSNRYRNTVDFWTGSVLSATGQANMASMMLGIAVSLLFVKITLRQKLLAIVIIVVTMLYNLILGGRTLFVIAILSVVASSLYLYINTDRVKIKVVVRALLIFLLLYIAFKINFLNIKDIFESSNFYKRFFISSAQGLGEDTRMYNKLFYLKNFGDGIFGGLHLRKQTGYAHDIFLDTYDEAGIFALAAMILFVINSIKTFVRFIKNELYSLPTRQIVFGLFVATYFQFIMEPILQGAPRLFLMFCFISGMIANAEIQNRGHKIVNVMNKDMFHK